MIAVIASICLGAAACQDVVVTTSEQDSRVTMTSCAMTAPAAIVAWMAANKPGYRLVGWKCVFGRKGQST